MGKRKNASSEEEIRRKIRKLERKLAKNKQSCAINSSQSDEIISDAGEQVPLSPLLDTVLTDSILETPQYVNIGWDELQEHNNSSACEHPTQENVLPEPVPSTSKEQEEVPLDEWLLQLLGEAPKPESALDKPIHKDLASRWSEILSKGLQKDVQEKLLQDYEIPKNCDLLLAPVLNPEAKAALPYTLVKRDSYLLYKQRQHGVALSALANTIGLVIANETSKQVRLKPLSDACRILCNIHFSETKTRRKLGIASVNINIKDALTDTTRDKLLFGENVTEKLKAAQSIQRSGAMLKNTPRFFPRNNFNGPNNKHSYLNCKPHRKVDQKPATRYPQAPPSTTASRPAHRRHIIAFAHLRGRTITTDSE